MPETIISALTHLASLLFGGAAAGYFARRSVHDLDRRLDVLEKSVKEAAALVLVAKAELRESMQRRATAVSEAILDVRGSSEKRDRELADAMLQIRNNADFVEKDALDRHAQLSLQLSEIMANLPREYVRMQQFESTVNDIKSWQRDADRKLDRRFDEVIAAIKRER